MVETIREPGRYGDGDGLQLIVSPSGTKKWVYRFQMQRRRRDMGLGSFPDVSLATARGLLADARRHVAAGIDPVAARVAARRVKPIPTFRSVAAEVIGHAQAKSTNAKARYQWDLLLGETYCKSILDKAVNAITTRDIERLLRPVWTSKSETAKKLHRRLRRVFEHARIVLRDEHGVEMTENPARWDDLKALGFTSPKKLSRGPQPALNYNDVPALLAAIRTSDGMSARGLELLLFTGVRTDAVRRAEWSEFDLDAKIWTIPVDRLKDRATRTEPFRVPLAPQVVERLQAWRKQQVGAYVFPGQAGGRPISNMAMLTFLKKLNRDGKGKPIWKDPRDGRATVPHGFRATFRTWAEEETHFPRAVMEEALGHQVGTAVERAYRRTDVLEKRRALMMEWAAHCCGGKPERTSI